MLNIFGTNKRFCDGYTRRDFLAAGALGVGGLSLADVFRLQASGGIRSSTKSVIMVVLAGGPSHIDMYDLKPEAPAEFRGDFRPIQTNVPGFDLCEHMPLQTKIADKLALVRSIQTIDPNHNLHECLTGFTFDKHRPAFGSVASRFRSPRDLPGYVSFVTVPAGTQNETAEDPSYLGSAHRAFRPNEEGLRNLEMCPGVTPERLAERKALLRILNNLPDIDSRGETAALDTFTARALDVITSPAARDAFDISRESEATREKYGGEVRHKIYGGPYGVYDGRLFLQARRLVEAGVPVVTLRVGGWDHHDDIFNVLRSELPYYDKSIYALVTDLHERGMDKDVAVVVWGEFGRVPRISPNGDAGGGPGRGHFPPVGFALFAGGGLQTGQVIGATDGRAETLKTRPISPQNVLATLYRHLGIDPSETFLSTSGRPMYVLDEREPIRELL